MHKLWDWSGAFAPKHASVPWYIDHLEDRAPGIDGIRFFRAVHSLDLFLLSARTRSHLFLLFCADFWLIVCCPLFSAEFQQK